MSDAPRSVELSDALLAKIGGWEAVKQARALLGTGCILSSAWQPPLLRGVVQDGSASLRAGLVIHSETDVENLCPCRQSRQYGTICAHSLAVGLHYLQSLKPVEKTASVKNTPSPAPAKPQPALRAIRRAGEDETGDALEIFLILPPNFLQAAAKGRVMVCLEGRWHDGRSPLNALPMRTPFALSRQDAAVLDLFETYNGGETPAMAMLSVQQFTEVLARLSGHPRVTLGKSQAIEISSEPLVPPIRATLESNGEIAIRLTGSAPTGLIRGSTIWVMDRSTIRPLGLPAGLEELLTGPMRIPRQRVPQFLNLEWPQLVAGGNVESDFSPEDFTLEPAQPRFKLHLAGGIAVMQAKLECFYGEKPVTPGVTNANDALWLPDPASPTRYSTRDFAGEQLALARLMRYGFSPPDAQGQCRLNVQNLILKFFAVEFPRLQREWDVTLEERLDRSTRQNLERIEPQFEVISSGEQWFDLSVSYNASGGEGFSAAEIQRLLLSGQSHTRLKNGKFALIDTGAVEELQEVLLDCAPQQHANGFRLNSVQAGFLDATIRRQPGWKIQAPAAWTQRAACQRGEIHLAPPPLGALENVLRPYQKDGVAWLQFLRTSHFGGILADEMGLGKTLQMLAHLCCSERQAPSLVVCPTSLVFNWAAEAVKFTPNLRVLTLHGPNRHEHFGKIASHDLVITSYALIRRDAELYRGIEFDTVILDEAQHIKNRQTQNAQAVKSIRARHRLVLTGTPMENSVLDLWSVFDFLMPGYLGAAKDFRERYEAPITRDKNAEAQSRLARRLRPFMLRRVKRDVAADLPEKIEQVSYCELTDSQRAVYQQMLEASRREVFGTVTSATLGQNRMVVLTALLRLRQICCDLRLLQADQPPADSSGKVDLFAELLEEIIDGGHRALVFSQFTTMLGLLSDRLKEENIEFCYLDGSTKNRTEVVEKFQRDANIPVFLISLKAGGTGLNLTGADTVIHFDPWWNPAVEAQATDRAHRIGQKKVVTSYKLITRDTVEEKILNLQTRKRALIQGMLGDEEQLAQSLNWEEIQELLAG